MALGRLGEAPRRRPKARCLAEKLEFGVGKVQLPLVQWLEEATLHADLAKDVAERFGDVKQQAEEVVKDVVQRVQTGAQRCVAGAAVERCVPYPS